MVQWLCQCDCKDKTLVVVIGNNLKKKNGTKSCGCLNKEVVSFNSRTKNRKYNTYDLSGEYGIGYTAKGEEFYFDLEDYDKIKDYYWSVNGKNGYIRTFINGVTVMMHRFITDCPTNMSIDHIHGNKTRNNNRKNNLRICTAQENGMNVGLQSNNTSGCTGVIWNKHRNTWMATIKYNNKRIYLGSYKIFEDAVKARKEAEDKYFGEFSYDNSQRR